MRIRALRIWLIMILPVILIGWLLYNDVSENKLALEAQGKRSVDLARELIESNWDQAYNRYINQLDLYIQTKGTKASYYKSREVKVNDSLLYQNLYGKETDKIKIWSSRYDNEETLPDTLITRVNHSAPANIPEAKLMEGFKGELSFRLAVPIKDLLAYYGNQEFFDHIILIDTSGRIVYASSRELLHSQVNPSHLYTSSRGLGVQDTLMNVSSKEYHAYTTPVHIVDTRLYVIGMISDYRFKVASRRLSFTLISVLVFAIMLILASYPIIRIVEASRADFIKKYQIFELGISLILVSMLIGTFGSFIMSSHHMKQEAKEWVAHLVDHVQGDHQKAINCYLDNLKSATLNNCGDPLVIFNEGIVLDKQGVADLTLNDRSSGKMVKFSRDLSGRHYFRNARKNKYYLGSHFSKGTGKPEGVISLKSDSGKVEAITYKFDVYDSLDILKNTNGLRYMIIKPEGDIYYKSPTIKTYFPDIEHGVGPESWNEIKAIMSSYHEIDTASVELAVFLNGTPYTGNLQKLNFDFNQYKLAEPLWILVFEDTSLYHLRNFLVMELSVISLLPYLLILAILILIAYATQRQSSYLNTARYSYSWFRPSSKSISEYLILLIVIVFHIAYLTGISLYQNNFMIIIVVCSEFAVVISLVNYLTLGGAIGRFRYGNSHEGDHLNIWSKSIIILIHIAALMTMMDYFESNKSVFKIIMVGHVTFILSLAIFFLFWRGREKRFREQVNISDNTVRISRKLHYVVFTLWMLALGFFPGFLIHHNVSHYENTVWELSSETYTSQVLHPSKLIENFEAQRRKLFSNFTEVKNRAVIKYLSPSENHLSKALLTDGAGPLYLKNYISAVLFAVVALLFILVRYLIWKVFLLEYCRKEEGVSQLTSHFRLTLAHQPYLYITALETQVALDYIKNHLSGENIKFVDVANESRKQLLTELTREETKDIDRLAILNLQCCTSLEEIRALQLLISFCRKSDLSMLVISAVSLRSFELTVKRSDTEDTGLHNAISETLSNFISVSVPLGTDLDDKGLRSLADQVSELKPEFIGSYLDNEVTTGLMMEVLGRPNRTDALERTIVEIEGLNLATHLNIWHELSFNEKKMVYNMASQGFVNYKNAKVLLSLLQKGVFRVNQSLDGVYLFNEGFCDFVATAPSHEMKEEFRKDVRKYGNSKNIRYALITLIFLVIFAVSWYNVGVYDQIIKVISASLAIASSLLAFFGNITNKSFFNRPTKPS